MAQDRVELTRSEATFGVCVGGEACRRAAQLFLVCVTKSGTLLGRGGGVGLGGGGGKEMNGV